MKIGRSPWVRGAPDGVPFPLAYLCAAGAAVAVGPPKMARPTVHSGVSGSNKKQ